jgi:hypothetical protein
MEELATTRRPLDAKNEAEFNAQSDRRYFAAKALYTRRSLGQIKADCLAAIEQEKA